MSTILEVRNVSRDFPAPSREAPGVTLADRFEALVRLPFGPRPVRPQGRRFRALDDVSFTLAAGEVVGVIGRNGAGKSTLLRILSRVIRPTAGEIDIYGRVGSLLEVGTGFHPDLSGRENVYLNGALLGMSRADVAEKFQAITEFAEIGDFLDAPLKHYSAGMYLRLAFAVAIQLEAEVLLLDEVLSVGDEWFGRKCRARVTEACQAGRTILVVGHDLNALRAMCSRLILLDRGRLVLDGPPDQVIDHYLALYNPAGERARA